MSDSDRLAELEEKVARCARVKALTDAVDERLEAALRERRPLERVMPTLLEILVTQLGARAAAVRTFDESLAERVFSHGKLELSGALQAASAAERERDLGPDGFALLHPLDVAGDDLGRVVALFDAAPGEEAHVLLTAFAEELDNHLAAIAVARRHYEVIRSISDALKDPVLDLGIAHAISIIQRHVAFDDLVLMFRHEDDLEAGGLRYQVYADGRLKHDSTRVEDPALDAFVRSHAPAFFDGDDDELRARFEIQRYREEVLITGVRDTRVVGRMLVTSRQGEFHTYDRELLDRFADYLRQRIVDFNREWKQLSSMFSTLDCERLLSEEDYVERWLTPRERQAAILYGDIAGFTRVSEQVLKVPSAIGRLIDTWSDGAVQIIWNAGGVFDKMIGDCVIGLFGPPFFERSPEDVCARALRAAEEIRELTRSLTSDARLPELAALETPLDVAIGLNYCPVSVGLFGPNENYTAFSSGMNNAARLQGVAKGGEILCMESFVAALSDDARFGEAMGAEVKNVRDPLPYRVVR